MSGAVYAATLSRAMWQRSLNEILRVRGALLPTTVAPMIFLLGTTGQFGKLADLSGFPTTSYLAWILPLSCLQGAGFAGGAAGANLARDIEQGWFDRLLTSPAPRFLLLAGPVLAAMTRAALPTTVILLTGLALGSGLSGGILGLIALYVAAVWFCMIASLWGSSMALRARTQQVGPLIQNGVFLVVFLSTAYTPIGLLDGWLGTFAKYNPVTYVLEMARQATVVGIPPSWEHTWPGLLSLTAMTIVFGALALRELRRMGD
ncbi:MAG TPA: ABC transporter permease [Solirubrobacteraceae bacterium]|jgi:ABC-2 type transport system permease protein|nr:ABC transporter permease [Solirubrobacteraceae bacterium]